MATGVQIVFDCIEPDKLATFWAAALHYKKQELRSAIVDPDRTGPRIFFQQVPESKTVKNRVHLDLNIGGAFGTPPETRRRRIDAEVERILRIGGRKARTVEERGGYFVNMLDPEGNEFDVH
jgi:hypothetical protein